MEYALVAGGYLAGLCLGLLGFVISVSERILAPGHAAGSDAQRASTDGAGWAWWWTIFLGSLAGYWLARRRPLTCAFLFAVALLALDLVLIARYGVFLPFTLPLEPLAWYLVWRHWRIRRYARGHAETIFARWWRRRCRLRLRAPA